MEEPRNPPSGCQFVQVPGSNHLPVFNRAEQWYESGNSGTLLAHIIMVQQYSLPRNAQRRKFPRTTAARRVAQA